MKRGNASSGVVKDAVRRLLILVLISKPLNHNFRKELVIESWLTEPRLSIKIVDLRWPCRDIRPSVSGDGWLVTPSRQHQRFIQPRYHASVPYSLEARRARISGYTGNKQLQHKRFHSCNGM